MKQIHYPARELPLRAEYEMLICGAGLAGVAAAVYAARRGVKVGMIEYFGKPGGVPVTGMLGVVTGFVCGEERFAYSFVNELRRRAEALNGVTDGGFYLMFDPELLGRILLDLLAENGIEIHFYTQLIDALREGDRVRYAVTASKAGLAAVGARLFVDATGDGDLAVRAGCRYEQGRPEDGRVQSSSLTFKIGGIDQARAPKTVPEMTAIWRQFPHQVPTNHVVIKYPPARDGRLEGVVNMTHILDCDPLNPDDQARIRREGTRQAYEILDFFRQRVPGFEHAGITGIAEQLGVRESRRILGDYVLTADDVLAGRDFPDELVRCGWGIDVHNPVAMHTGGGSRPTKSYGVPYRCLTPLGVRNLYIAGRPISTTHQAFASTRINSCCVGLGEAIGLAAPEAIRLGDTRKVDVSRLQRELEQLGTTVHRPGVGGDKPAE